MKPTVLITDFMDGQWEAEELPEANVVVAKDLEDVVVRAPKADVLIVYDMKIGWLVINALHQCKAIVRGGAGYDNVDHYHARCRGIPVVTVPGFGPQDVANTTIGLMLSLLRGINYYNQALVTSETAKWSYDLIPHSLNRLEDQWLGIVGLGRIGTAVALRAKALGMPVCFYDPYKPDGYDRSLGISQVSSMDHLMQRSTVISLHCPLTAETRELVDLWRLNKGSYLINTARGGLLRNNHILSAFEDGRLLGAGLDVLYEEPASPADLLIRAWQEPGSLVNRNLILTPHAAFYTEQGLLAIRRGTVMAAKAALAGKKLRNVVN